MVKEIGGYPKRDTTLFARQRTRGEVDTLIIRKESDSLFEECSKIRIGDEVKERYGRRRDVIPKIGVLT